MQLEGGVAAGYASDRERRFAVLCHLWAWTGVTVILAPLIVRRRRAWSDALVETALDVVNLQVMLLLVTLVVLVGFLVLPALALVALFAVALVFDVSCYVLGAIGAWNARAGRVWRYPLPLRILR